MYIDEISGKEYRIIGICVCGIQEENVHDIVKSICKRAEKSGYKVLLFSSFDEMINCEEVISFFTSLVSLAKKAGFGTQRA